jgi:hypothetical protein
VSDRAANEPSAFFTSPAGEELFIDRLAVIQLLNAAWLFVHDAVVDEEPTLGLSLLINDVFVWGGADYEPVPENALRDLYRDWRADTDWGPIRWACIRRNEQPQKPIADRMRAAGAWDEAMEALRPNLYDNHGPEAMKAAQMEVRIAPMAAEPMCPASGRPASGAPAGAVTPDVPGEEATP